MQKYTPRLILGLSILTPVCAAVLYLMLSVTGTETASTSRVDAGSSVQEMRIQGA